MILLVTLGPTLSFAQSSGRYFNRAIIVIFENTEYGRTIQQPFFKSLADQGANFDQMYAISRPSQPNYFALTSGTTNNVQTNNNVDLDLTNIVDLLEARGLTWKAYVEDYPEKCFTGKSSGGYARKHNPFISYLNIQGNPARCANIVNASRFQADSKVGRLPNYVFYVPNNKNSAHDTSIQYADKWYSKMFGPLVTNAAFMKDTVLISTFDEGSFTATKNQIYTSIVGPMVKPGTYSDKVSIYSILKMLEDNWNLGSLGREDWKAKDLPQIWLK
ncbi:MAG: hypothetical protein KF681_08625 [Bdellovibrionaceae bacterium]|nr:hypothetical protein [Pseudobdellovibrionaceae bacterium]